MKRPRAGGQLTGAGGGEDRVHKRTASSPLPPLLTERDVTVVVEVVPVRLASVLLQLSSSTVLTVSGSGTHRSYHQHKGRVHLAPRVELPWERLCTGNGTEEVETTRMTTAREFACNECLLSACLLMLPILIN